MSLALEQPSPTTPAPEAAGGGVGGAAAGGQRRIEELGRIILAYSEVTDRLQKSHEQLTQTVERLQQELGEKNRLLERRKRLAALGEMAAGMAHEIRNPLGAIQLYASMLSGDLKSLPESAKLVDKISSGVRRMEDIVTRVLQFSRDLRVSPAEHDLPTMLRECADLASGRGVEVVLQGPDPLPARFDRLTLSQAVLNLLVNAVEASPEGATVTLAWAREGKKTLVRVTDAGPGVPPDVMDKIFNPFFTTKDHGTGLGLAITHRILEAHDGSISVQNAPPPRQGATFELRF